MVSSRMSYAGGEKLVVKRGSNGFREVLEKKRIFKLNGVKM